MVDICNPLNFIVRSGYHMHDRIISGEAFIDFKTFMTSDFIIIIITGGETKTLACLDRRSYRNVQLMKVQ